jgi:6-phosphogluconolactonase
MSRKGIGSFICTLFVSLPAGEAWADGAVYAMTNALGNNQVLVYHRSSNGSLSALVQTAATGGGGSGLQLAGVDALGSAGSLVLDSNHRFLFAVNTESAAENNGVGTYNTDCRQGTITSFRVEADGTLTFADRVFSGGLFPDSLAVTKERHGDRDLLYVLNAGGPEPPAVCNLTPGTANTPNITGFRVDAAGHMIPLDSTQPIDPGPATANGGGSCTASAAFGFMQLTGAPAADFQCGLNPPSFPLSPGQVLFTPDGGRLIVTVKGTNTIYVFPVEEDGSVDAPTTTQATGVLPTYFGMIFDRNGDLLVTEAFGSSLMVPSVGTGAVSSFNVQRNGGLVAISSHIADAGTAACWIALEPITGKFAYVSNSLSASVSSYTVSTGGSLALLNGLAAVGSGPNDLATATEGGASFLYVLDAGTGLVGAFRINTTSGALTALTGGSGLPVNRSAEGLAAY